MIKKLSVLLFFTISSSVFSTAGNYVYFSKTVDGAGSFAHVDPVLNSQKQFSGFIYSDYLNKKIIVDRIDSDFPISIDLDEPPLKTINFIDHDTLTIYTVTSGSDLSFSKIYLHKIYNEEVLSLSISPRCYSTYFLRKSHLYTNIEFRDTPENKKIVVFETLIRFDEYFETMGVVIEDISTTIGYDLSLNETVFRKPSTNFYSGNLSELNLADQIFIEKSYSYYDLSDLNQPPNINTYSKSYLDIFNYADQQIFSATMGYNNINKILIHDFIQSTPYDEMIFYGTAPDFTGSYPETVQHAACYDFSMGTPELIWYNDNIGNVNLTYIYTRKDYIVGIRNGNEILFLDYTTGRLSDSTYLDNIISSPVFFENDESLMLSAKSGDSVTVYRFDIPTYVSIESTIEEVIPSTFTLQQNHPNPFNGETRLEFNNEQYQHLSFTIYNILGQEIIKLADKSFSPGRHYFYWDGKDQYGIEQSTGIYFARLQGDENSAMIKITYIK